VLGNARLSNTISSDLNVEDNRKQDIRADIGKWSFCAHDFSEDELVYAGYYMLDHVLKIPELENWRMNQGKLERNNGLLELQLNDAL
jgi:3',5'-cyclic-nucleotide phosphodiesterase